MLTLKRASKSRPSGQWSDDYDVFDGEQHIGRIMWTHAAPEDRRWFWTITARVPQSTHDRGYAATVTQAMEDFGAVGCLINVRSCPKADKLLQRGDCPLCAKSDRCTAAISTSIRSPRRRGQALPAV